jgi:hypothetical protein
MEKGLAAAAPATSTPRQARRLDPTPTAFQRFLVLLGFFGFGGGGAS